MCISILTYIHTYIHIHITYLDSGKRCTHTTHNPTNSDAYIVHTTDDDVEKEISEERMGLC